MPKSSVAVPHLEQFGRVIELECGVAGYRWSWEPLSARSPPIDRVGNPITSAH